MSEPVIHVSLDLTRAAIILFALLLVALSLVFLASWYWIRRLTHSAPSDGETDQVLFTLVADEGALKEGSGLGTDEDLVQGRPESVSASQVEAPPPGVPEGHAESGRRLVIDRLEIDLNRWKVWMAGREVQLTPMEFQVLRFLAEHPGRVYTRRQIREGVLSPDATVDVDINSRDMDKHISVLRRRLEPNPSMPQYILTVRGVGYKFREK